MLFTLVVGAVFLAWSGRPEQSTAVPEINKTPSPPLMAPLPTSISIAEAPTVTLPLTTPRPVSPTPTHFPVSPTLTLSPAEALDRALLGSVQIIVPFDNQGPASTGSGSILTKQGHILTNFHVLGEPITGQLFNNQAVIFVAISPPNLKEPPEIKYLAELVESDRHLDLALLRIIARQDGSNLPTDLGLAPIPVGDSDTVKIGDELSIIGFPGLGGDTVTLTRGSVSGFLPAEGWIKTDAEINPGNSGGTAINREGQLIGIPTQVTLETDDLPGKIGLIRPVNLARPLIDLALGAER